MSITDDRHAEAMALLDEIEADTRRAIANVRLCLEAIAPGEASRRPAGVGEGGTAAPLPVTDTNLFGERLLTPAEIRAKVEAAGQAGEDFGQIRIGHDWLEVYAVSGRPGNRRQFLHLLLEDGTGVAKDFDPADTIPFRTAAEKPAAEQVGAGR